MKTVFYLFTISILFVPLTYATSTTTALYKLGEDDPDAAIGSVAADPTIASVGRDIPLASGAPIYSAGQFSDIAVIFDGDDYYNVGENLLGHSDNYGFEAWAKADALDSYNFLVSAGTNYGGISLVQIGNKMGVLAPGSGWPVPAAFDISLGQWHHYAAVCNGGTIQFYVDGVLIGSGTNIAKPIQNSFTIGANDKVNGGSATSTSPLFEGFWKGSIDHVRVFTFPPGLFVPELDLSLAPSVIAFDPTPSDTAVKIEKDNVTLRFSPGVNAISHDIYFGTSRSAVENASHDSPEFQTNLTGTFFNLVNLDYDTTYYWCVDEIEADSVQRGNTWSFTTMSEPVDPEEPESIIGDLDGNDIVDFDDFVIFAAHWLESKEVVTIESLLDEMVDRDRIAKFPIPYYDCRQFSSYNRASVTPDNYEGWFADSDGTQCIRTEVNSQGQTEWVMMEHNGPGVVTHLWTPYFHYSLSNHIGPEVRFYLDGSETPVIAEDFIPFLEGKRFLKPPFAVSTVRAGDIYFPITYSKSCKITTNSKNFYNIINYRAYEPGTIVETFTMEKFDSLTDKLQTVGDKLQTVENYNGTNTVSLNETLAHNGEASVTLPAGPSAVRTIEISVDKFNTPQVLRSTVLSATFDGEETVWVPLGDLFSGVKQRAYDGWYRSVEQDGKMVSRFVMPYSRSGEIKIINFGSETISVNLKAAVDSWAWNDQSMLFHANWRHKYPQTTIPCSDFNFIDIEGKGVFVGDMLSVGVPIGGWWGEGDEKIYVDGDTFPTHFGTGTEDYYGYAGGVVPAVSDFFDEPFIGQIRAECFPNGQNVQYRTRMLDAIPFKTSLSMNMEISRALFGAKVDHAVSTTTFWYALPGASSNRGAEIEEASRPIPLLGL